MNLSFSFPERPISLENSEISIEGGKAERISDSLLDSFKL
jgi:hypothetical protein